MMLDAQDVAGKPANLEPVTADYGRSKIRTSLVRPILDAAGTFAILCLICLSVGAAPSSASPNVPAAVTYQNAQKPVAIKAIAEADVHPVVEIAITSSPANADAVYHRTSAQAAWALILLGLSAAAALNMALFRHLRQAYASPRRRGSQN
jgi:hypothetical protein